MPFHHAQGAAAAARTYGIKHAGAVVDAVTSAAGHGPLHAPGLSGLAARLKHRYTDPLPAAGAAAVGLGGLALLGRPAQEPAPLHVIPSAPLRQPYIP